MISNWFTNFDFSNFNSLFDVDELESLYEKVISRLNEEAKKSKKCKDDEVESYKHFDKKVYKGDTLVDHVEKEYKNGNCVKDVHEPCLGISCASSVLDNGCCGKHKCCSKDKEEEPKIKKLSCQKNVNILSDPYTEIMDLQKDIDKLKKENIELKNKLNKIKNIF